MYTAFFFQCLTLLVGMEDKEIHNQHFQKGLQNKISTTNNISSLIVILQKSFKATMPLFLSIISEISKTNINLELT